MGGLLSPGPPRSSVTCKGYFREQNGVQANGFQVVETVNVKQALWGLSSIPGWLQINGDNITSCSWDGRGSWMTAASHRSPPGRNRGPWGRHGQVFPDHEKITSLSGARMLGCPVGSVTHRLMSLASGSSSCWNQLALHRESLCRWFYALITRAFPADWQAGSLPRALDAAQRRQWGWRQGNCWAGKGGVQSWGLHLFI